MKFWNWFKNLFRRDELLNLYRESYDISLNLNSYLANEINRLEYVNKDDLRYDLALFSAVLLTLDRNEIILNKELVNKFYKNESELTLSIEETKDDYMFKLVERNHNKL